MSDTAKRLMKLIEISGRDTSKGSGATSSSTIGETLLLFAPLLLDAAAEIEELERRTESAEFLLRVSVDGLREHLANLRSLLTETTRIAWELHEKTTDDRRPFATSIGWAKLCAQLSENDRSLADPELATIAKPT